MEAKTTYIALGAIVVLALILTYAYQRGDLNRVLPQKWQKQESFVGAYGRTPGMQHCLAYSGPDKRWFHFNRCTYV